MGNKVGPLKLDKSNCENFVFIGSPILVESAFEITNGLSGMKRDVILGLCILMNWQSKSMRSIFGISQEYVTWKNHKYFVTHRKGYIAISLLPNSLEGCVFINELSGPRCVFNGWGNRTVFANHALRKGIFRWTVRISYAEKNKMIDSHFYVGAAPFDQLSMCMRSTLGEVEGTWSFHFWRDKDGSLSSNMLGDADFPSKLIPVPDESIISIEADCAAHTLAFFAREVKVPHVIAGVCGFLYLGMSGHSNGSDVGGAAFTSMSFRCLSFATPSAVV